jgi:hypothetical protein
MSRHITTYIQTFISTLDYKPDGNIDKFATYSVFQEEDYYIIEAGLYSADSGYALDEATCHLPKIPFDYFFIQRDEKNFDTIEGLDCTRRTEERPVMFQVQFEWSNNVLKISWRNEEGKEEIGRLQEGDKNERI